MAKVWAYFPSAIKLTSAIKRIRMASISTSCCDSHATVEIQNLASEETP